MRVSYGLPTHRVDRGEEFLAPGAVGELAAAAEAAGFSAVYTTDHPFPGDAWLAHGGHHSLDPLVVLSMAAACDPDHPPPHQPVDRRLPESVPRGEGRRVP